MRVLLSTIGSRGDVQPLLALALELRALGQDVQFCVPPDFQAWLTGLGFAATPIGPELRTMMAVKPSGPAPAPMTPEQRKQLAEASVAAQFQTVAAAAEGCDVIVAATALQIAARSVAETLGIRYVFAAYCANVLPSPHHAPPPLPPIPGMPAAAAGTNAELWARDGERFTTLFGPALNAHRMTLGLEPVTDVRAHMFGDQPWLAADRALAPWPDPADASVFQPGAWIGRGRASAVGRDRGVPGRGRAADLFRVRQHAGGTRAEPRDDRDGARARTPCPRVARVGRSRAARCRCRWPGDRRGQPAGAVRRVAAVVHHGGAGTTTRPRWPAPRRSSSRSSTTSTTGAARPRAGNRRGPRAWRADDGLPHGRAGAGAGARRGVRRACLGVDGDSRRGGGSRPSGWSRDDRIAVGMRLGVNTYIWGATSARRTSICCRG